MQMCKEVGMQYLLIAALLLIYFLKMEQYGI